MTEFGLLIVLVLLIVAVAGVTAWIESEMRRG